MGYCRLSLYGNGGQMVGIQGQLLDKRSHGILLRKQKGRESTPAETGTLIDERVDLKDIYGSLIDLARRGHFRIIETKRIRLI